MAGELAAQRLGLAALAQVLPPDRVESALTSCGRVAQRVRTLPPWVTTYHVLVSAMYPSMGYDEVTALLWPTLPAATGRSLALQRPSRGAITRARLRIGVDPLECLLRDLLGSRLPAASAERVYLQKLTGPGTPIWWIGDGGSVGLLGCDVRGGDAGAAVDLVNRVAAQIVVVCPPHDDTSLQVRERLGAAIAVEVGEPPEGPVSTWAGLRARSSATWAQDALARACVTVAAELALSASRVAGDPRS
ncbi:hypothetical protein MMUR_58890 [Mycolicibacterium murale]|uniref:Transposase IS4 N-terminal domain-containing protein n=1 Tax=Mycolicibacterium murale TaxID=182220 RepID=A0A7I9WVP1_9MYCO|nr:transposase domain-containing protein [Mycolicibacterium murale]MCV7185637.1 transposase domain-containing protein [Mycolicibacterium murale]GFG61753.1 hypothetical protein MMUR_58890 [Mycolicibacterium murale]